MKTYVTLTFLVVFGFALIAGLSSPINLFTSPTQASADPCDWDGDGYTSISCGGEDCNDFNSAVHPGATEDCNNRWDDDCDGDTNMQAQQDECANLGMSWFAPTCTCNPSSPVIIDLLGNGFHLTNAQGGVNFDINNDGQTARLSWTAVGTDDAFLVLDRNGNGAIDGGAELFGNFTAQPLSEDPNGFIALAEFDKAENGGNGDKAISASDTVFALLRLWEDSNHNGVSEPGELHSLGDKSISSIELKYKISRRLDQYGNAFLYRAKVHDLRSGNVGKWAWDVFLLTQ